MKDILDQHTITQINLIKSHNRSTIYTGIYNGQKKFIKYTPLTENAYTLRSEITFNHFIQHYFSQQNFVTIPHTQLIEGTDYLLALFDFYECPAFAATDPFALYSLPNQQQTQKLINFCELLNNIPQKNIPEYFLQRVLTQNDYLQKLNNYINPVLNKIVSKQQFNNMQELFMSQKITYKLCHHDFILWNMLNDDDDIILVDAEHSRFGMQWYDIAYFVLQTYISLNQKKYAQEFLENAFEKFKNSTIQTTILIPSVYRLSAKLNEFKNEPAMLERTHELLEIILDGDLKKF